MTYRKEQLVNAGIRRDYWEFVLTHGWVVPAVILAVFALGVVLGAVMT